jgi:hypothetical protein
MNPRWLLLTHQIPSEPSNARVKVWRRLQTLGAAPIKNSIYVLPNRPDTREIIQGLLDNFNGVQSDVRWGFNEEVSIPDDIHPLKKPGLQITGPSDPLDMAMKQLNGDLSVRMPDLEDASAAWYVPNGAPASQKVGAFQGIQNEAELFRGDWEGRKFVNYIILYYFSTLVSFIYQFWVSRNRKAESKSLFMLTPLMFLLIK